MADGADAVLLLLLLLPGERIMKLAEELYQSGYISYPRTETDAYDPGMDLRVRARVLCC
jgi:DNA topoisomerase-3